MFGQLLERLQPQMSKRLHDALERIVHWRNICGTMRRVGGLPSDDEMQRMMARIRRAAAFITPSNSQEAPPAAAAAAPTSTSRPPHRQSAPAIRASAEAVSLGLYSVAVVCREVTC